ncbi:LacI family DNA-binding transcriptional regulator [Roseibium algae]|uniref:LacI family DNA-binding transcriptional regulator n=1 Tax=Roseibium algae TaxID=3123038 RepID=A0ABU8TF23_9HYPH
MDQNSDMPSKVVPTLADVAAAAGVSTATVSRCLNLPDQVSEKTMQRVMAAVDRLGYSPNHSARALASRRTNTIGAIIPTMDNAIFARGIQAFQEELHLNGCTLLVASSSYEEDLEEEQIRTLTARGADALLLIGYHRRPQVYEFLNNRNVPTLVSWAFEPGSSQLSVGFNNREAMKNLAMVVLAQGHKTLGYISAHTASNDRARDRITGIRDALLEAGLNPDSMGLIETAYSIDNGDDAFRELMNTPTPPTAIMCGNDVLAVGALRAATDMGLKVPKDISITGFDDIELASAAPVPLTTVHVPHRRMGQFAARALIGALGTERQSESVELPTTVCFRDTLGPPG